MPRDHEIAVRFLRAGDALMAESRLVSEPPRGQQVAGPQYSRVDLNGDRMTMSPLQGAWAQEWEKANPDTGAAPAGGARSDAWVLRMLAAASRDAAAWGPPETMTRTARAATGRGSY
jgi:hypothetical protein